MPGRSDVVPTRPFCAALLISENPFLDLVAVCDRRAVATLVLYRPVGQKELDLIAASGWRRFPPRLDSQPIFYPVTHEEYATRIARDWNTKDAANGNVGYVTRFAVDATFIEAYETYEAGGRRFQEYWIPADHLDAFNDAITGTIEVIAEYRPSTEQPALDDVPHQIEVIEQEWGSSARWKCTCGASSGGRWLASPTEALKAAERHQRKRAS